MKVTIGYDYFVLISILLPVGVYILLAVIIELFKKGKTNDKHKRHRKRD